MCVDVLSGHTHHQLLERPLSVVLVHQQNFFDGILLEAHLIELTEKVQELLRLHGKKFLFHYTAPF